MRANVNVIVTEIDIGRYVAKAEATDDNGNTLFSIGFEFDRANEVYSGYKTIQRVSGRFQRHGITEFTLKTNVKAIVDELNGEDNANNLLKRYTLERFERYSVKLNKISYDTFGA